MRLTICLAWMFVISSCSLFDNDEVNPTYLDLEEAKLMTSFSEGSNTHKIKDVWVFANGEFLGVFELPASVPILTEGGTTEFRLFAGIRNNGLSENPIIYPFYASDDFSLDLSPGERFSRQPSFKYKDNIVFEFIEDFEGSNLFSVDVDQDTATVLVRTDEDVLSGNMSGFTELSSDHRVMESTSSVFFDRSDFLGGDVFVEIDYKSQAELLVGVQTQTNGVTENNYMVGTNPNTEWNKLYVDLTSILASTSIEEYRILLSAGLPSGKAASKSYVDNIKLIHF